MAPVGILQLGAITGSFCYDETMKPKLIILNGPLGIGKSTLAKRYGENHPLTLQLDIDDVWSMISHWREEKETSSPISKKMALEMARVNLSAGNDVIIPQIIRTEELADNFEALTKECGADYVEVLLFVEKEEAIRRFIKRGQEGGSPTGFRPGGIIDTGGRETKLAEMYDDMIEVANRRQHVIRIEPILGDIEGTYLALMAKING